MPEIIPSQDAEPSQPLPVIPIVDPTAALSALKFISNEWVQREFQESSRRNMVKGVAALSVDKPMTEDERFVLQPKASMERAERKADDLVIEAEADIAQAIGVKATVQLESTRGTIKRRLVSDKPEQQATLDRAIHSAWKTYGGHQNASRRAAALTGRAAIDFSGTTIESRHPHPAQRLDQDRLLHVDGSTIKELSPGAQVGASALYWAMLAASAINSKEAASKNGLVQILPQKYLPKSVQTDYERIQRDFSQEELMAMEKNLLHEAAKHATALRIQGLLPAVVTANTLEQFRKQVQVELGQPGTDERMKVRDTLKEVLDNAGVILELPQRPKPKRRTSKGKAKVSKEQISFDTLES
jgi:hypothetical protein